MNNHEVFTSTGPVEYEDAGPRYSETYLARVGRYRQTFSRNSNNKIIDFNDISVDNDRITIIAPTRDFVEEDDKETENILIPDRFCQPESPTISNCDFGDSSITIDNTFLTVNHNNDFKRKPPTIYLQRQNSEDKELNFGGLGPIKKSPVAKERTVIENKARQSGWAKLFASTLQRSKSTITSEVNSNNQKVIKLRPGRKSEQSTVSSASSISNTIQDSEICDASVAKLEMRKKKRSIGVDMKEKLNFFRKQQGENTLSNTSSTPTNRSSSVSPHFTINLENVWKSTIGYPTREQVLSWSQSFENVLYDQHGFILFLEFLRSEFSDENLEFWSECQTYRSIECPIKLQKKAIQIFEDYVAVQSPKEINLDSVTRIQTASEIGRPNNQTFDQSQKKIQALMEKDSYQRFLRSEIFHNLMNQLGISPSFPGKLIHTNSVPNEQASIKNSQILELFPKNSSIPKLNQSKTIISSNLMSSSSVGSQIYSGNYENRSAPSSPQIKTASYI